MHSTEQKQGVTFISNTVMKQHSRQLRAFHQGLIRKDDLEEMSLKLKDWDREGTTESS